MSDNKYGELHIYQQFTYHDYAQIKGTRLGLEALAAAVAEALKTGEAESDHVFVNDGEGYRVIVECVEDASTLQAPYTFLFVNSEIHQWRERAFEAEAELSRLRRQQVAANPEVKEKTR